MAEPARPFGTCTLCGDAVPHGSSSCPTCGHPEAVQEGQATGLRARARYRLRFVQGARAALIVGVIVGLSYLMVSAAVTPPTSAPDPLTTSEVLWIGPGNYSGISGEITGNDYVVGNYTVLNPPGAPISLLIFNASEFGHFTRHEAARPLYNVTGDSAARLLFSAPYTDTYHIVWENEYAPATGLVLGLYIQTSYQSNALVE